MSLDALIQGRGGKGGGGGGKESPDSIRSVQTAQLIDLISEGEIQGLVNGLKSVYLDGVPIENPDDSKNFEGVIFGILPGTQSQTALPGFDSVQSELPVGVEVRQSTPVVRTILNPSVDTVRVTIAVPQLTTLDTSTGNLTGASFTYAIDIQSAGGGYVEQHRETITDKTTSLYKRATRLKLPGAAPWDIRLRRITADSSSSTVVNAVQWDSYTEIQSVSLRYPNSAVAGLQVSARQFSRIPGRAYDVLGIRVQVPSNYDPIAGTYAGVWDGTFKIAWTNNPAWVYYDLATHPRYGVGQYIKAHHLSKWQLYEIGRYCDVRVPDGQGGTEPRFTCNLYLQTAVQARQALQDLAGLFRAITFWGNGQIVTVQDAPADAVMLFTKANIVGDFAYETVSRKTRHSVWTVYYNDLAQLGKRVPAMYVDPDLVRQLGVVPDTLSPIGCTSRGQATRLARWAAYSEAMGRTCAFRAGSSAVSVGPGHVIKVADPNKAGKRLGGRVRSATTTEITLDAPAQLEPGQDYHLEVMLPDPTVRMGYTTERRTVTTGSGEHQVLTISPAFSVAPLKATIWVLQPTNIQPTWWRVIGRKEVAGTNEFDLLCLQHDPDKYDAIEQGLKLAPKPTSGLSVVAPQVASIDLSESAYLDGPVPRIRANVSWPEPAQGLRYRVQWRLSNGPWTLLPDTTSNAVDLDSLQVGQLEVSVQTINSLGLVSVARRETLALEGKLLPPAAVSFGTATTLPGMLRVPYLPCADSDYAYTLLWVGASWASATLLPGQGSRDGYDWIWPPAGAQRVWARHFDSSGNGSTPSSIDLVVDAAQLRASSSTLSIKVNTGVFTGETNYNEAYIHGLNEAGQPADVPGYILINGKSVAVPNLAIFTSQGPVAAFLVFDTSGVGWPVTVDPAPHPVVMVWRYQGQWNYDNNGTWVPFTPSSTHYVIGTIETGGPDTGVPGTPPGIIAASMWAHASTLTSLVAAADQAYAAAAAAQGAADAAAGSAAAALGRLSIIDSNGYYDRGEKPSLLRDWQAIYDEQTPLYAEASTYGIVAERNAYVAAIDALAAYLNSLSPWWSDTSVDTPIVPAVSQAAWAAVYAARATLRRRISEEAGKVANWAGVANRPSDDAIRNNMVELGWWKRDAAIPWPPNSEYNRIISVSPAGGADLPLAGPKGSNDLVWYAEEQAGNGDAGGGWHAVPISLDPTRTYRLVVPMRRYSGSAGTMWWGTGNVENLNGQIVDYSDYGLGYTSANPNPYFVGGQRPEHADRWYLAVGYIFPAGSMNNTHESAGMWDCKTGARVAEGVNYRFRAGDGHVMHRAYQFYASPGAKQLFGRPLVSLVDGSEPSLREYFESGAVLNSTLIPSITAAQAAADAAQGTASAAAGSASAALSTLATMRSNGYIDAAEKPALIKQWISIYNEQAGIVAEANRYGITTQRDAYTAAISTHGGYLGGLAPSWDDTTSDTPITPAVDQASWGDVYGKRQALLNKIAEEAGKRAQWALVAGAGKPLDNAGLVVDLGDGTGPGQRQRDDAPDFYVTPGKYLQFKESGWLGLLGAEYWATLETTKQYFTDGGGGKTTQYAYSGTGTWRRTATSGGSGATWTAWVADLDRGNYTGALDATRNLVFRQGTDPGGAAIDGDSWQDTATGKSYKRVAGAWQPDVGPGSVNTGELANGAATDTFVVVDNNVAISGLSGSPLGSTTAIHTITFTAAANGLCTFASDDVFSWTSLLDPMGSGSYLNLGGRCWFNVSGLGNGTIQEFAAGELRETAANVHTATVSRTGQFGVTAGVSYTIQLRAQNAVYDQSMNSSGSLRAEVIKK